MIFTAGEDYARAASSALPVQSGREPSHFLPASDSIDLYLLFTQLSKNTALRASQQIAVGW